MLVTVHWLHESYPLNERRREKEKKNLFTLIESAAMGLGTSFLPMAVCLKPAVSSEFDSAWMIGAWEKSQDIRMRWEWFFDSSYFMLYFCTQTSPIPKNIDTNSRFVYEIFQLFK